MTWLTAIQHKHNISQAFFEEITNSNKLKTVIKNIRSGAGNVQIELLQFVSTFSIYKKLEHERQQLLQQIEEHQHHPDFKTLILQLEATSRQQKQFIISILQSAHQFTTIKGTETIQEVAEHFFAGDLDQANQVLEPTALQDQQSKHLAYLQLRLNLEKGYDGLEDNAEEFMVKGQLTMLNDEIPSAEKRLEMAIYYFESGRLSATSTQRVPFSGRYLFDYANFLQNNNQFNQAIALYVESLNGFRQLILKSSKNYQPVLGMILNNLGSLHSINDEFDQADIYYAEALTIYQQLALSDTTGYLPQLWMTLNGLGLLQRTKHEWLKAEDYLNDALAIIRPLAKKQQSEYLSDLAKTLNNLGVLMRDTGRLEQAETYHQEALQIRQQLADTDPQSYLPDLSMTLNNLGLLKRSQKDREQAIHYYLQALEIKRQLAVNNPQIYLHQVSNVLNNLGNLRRDQDQFDQALQYHQEALQIRDQLAEVYPKNYLSDLAGSLNNIALIYQIQEEWASSEEYYEKALEVYKDLTAIQPHTYLPDMAGTFNNLGMLHRKKQELVQAEQYFQQALEIRLQLAKVYPKVYLAKVAITLHELGNLYFYNKDLKEAENCYQQAIRIKEQLNNNNSNRFLHSPELANVLHNLALLQCQQEQWTAAEQSYQKELALRRDLADLKPQAHLLTLALTQINFADFYRSHLINQEASLKLVKAAISHLLPLQKTAPIQNHLQAAIKIMDHWNVDSTAIKARIIPPSSYDSSS